MSNGQDGGGVDLVLEPEPDAAAKTREPPPPILNFPLATTAIAFSYRADERSIRTCGHSPRARRECESILALWIEG